MAFSKRVSPKAEHNKEVISDIAYDDILVQTRDRLGNIIASAIVDISKEVARVGVANADIKDLRYIAQFDNADANKALGNPEYRGNNDPSICYHHPDIAKQLVDKALQYGATGHQAKIDAQENLVKFAEQLLDEAHAKLPETLRTNVAFELDGNNWAKNLVNSVAERIRDAKESGFGKQA